MFVRLFCVVAAALCLANCATVTRGTTNQIQITSEPSNTSVRTSLAQTCTTPCTLTVSRKDEFDVVFQRPGYREQIVPVRTQLAGAGAAGLVGNVIVGGVIGIGVDVVTGATLEHLPNPVHAVLEPIGPPPRAGRGKGKGKPRPEPVVQRPTEIIEEAPPQS